MSLWIFLRSKFFAVLLAITLLLSFFAFWLYLSLDIIVHGDLYSYGLIFSDEWALEYWSTSSLFRTLIGLVIALSGIGLVTFCLYRKKGRGVYRLVSIALSLVTFLLAILSLLVFLHLEWIVHHTLYDFGLTFSLAWANPYWTYANGILLMMGAAGGFVFFAILLLIDEGRIDTCEETTATYPVKRTKWNKFAAFPRLLMNRKVLSLIVIGVFLGAGLFILVFYRPVGLGGSTRYEPVLTGSMEPSLPVGSLVVISPVDPDSLQVGDVICYRFSDSVLITHRIVNVTLEGFQTKGDANEEPDREMVTTSQIVGSVVFSVPFLGYVGTVMKTPVGFMMLLVIPASLVIGYEIKTITYEMRKMKRENVSQLESSS